MEDFNLKPEDAEALKAEAEMAAKVDVVATGATEEVIVEERKEEELSDAFLAECLMVHPVLCESAKPHPLVRERTKYYYDMLRELSGVETVSEEAAVQREIQPGEP